MGIFHLFIYSFIFTRAFLASSYFVLCFTHLVLYIKGTGFLGRRVPNHWRLGDLKDANS